MTEPASTRTRFEGSYLGDAAGLSPDAKLECGICWTIYDPAEGDPVWQIPPGTPFSELPTDWRCPHCDAPKHKFMVLGADEPGTRADPVRARVAGIIEALRETEMRVRQLPIYNARLRIEPVGFRQLGAEIVGILVTPWFMNLAVLPLAETDLARGQQGAKRGLALPSGTYEVIGGQMKGVGLIEMCSLFSPMDAFETQETAVLAAEGALDELFAAPAPAPVEAVVSRRDLFRQAAE
jgi:[NiFe] hydrogenase assembly HybE family chaperone